MFMTRKLRMSDLFQDFFLVSKKRSKSSKPLHLSKVLSIKDVNSVRIAAQSLLHGCVIALPTDTIYGFACNANNGKAIQKLYAIKGRTETKPVAICVSQISDVRHWGQSSHLSDKLLHQLLPGAVTIVLNKTHHWKNPYLNPGIDRIGIRIPDFEFIRKLCAEFKEPLALTSANKSSEKSSLKIQEFENLYPQLEHVFEGGVLGDDEEQRKGSTVIDLSREKICLVIRKGIDFDKTISFIRDHHINVEYT